MRLKRLAAKWLYRWTYSQGIIGAIFSALTFAGVFALLLGPVLGPLGFTYTTTILLLLGLVAAVFFGLGFFLDRVVRFWAAQADISVVRNPYLYDRLYQKELLHLKTRDIPELRALRALLAVTGTHPELVASLDAKIERIESAVRDRRWTVEPGEEAYDEGQN